MSRRDLIRMTDEEVSRYLDENKTLTIVSNGPDGHPHPMPMWFTRDDDGPIRMGTYRTSQKIKNIQRDPKVTLLCESGTEYAELRGVVIYGHAEILDDYDLVVDTMLRASGQADGLPEDAGQADAHSRSHARHGFETLRDPDPARARGFLGPLQAGRNLLASGSPRFHHGGGFDLPPGFYSGRSL